MPRTDVYFDSASIPVSRRLRHWQDLVGDHLAGVEMRRPCNIPAERAFSGTLSLRAYEGVTFAQVCSANQHLSRTPQRIRCADRETALITIVLSGECHVTQDGRRAVLRAGDFCLYESVRPYEILTPGSFEALVVMADRQMVEASLGNLRTLTAIPVHGAEPAGFIAQRFWQDLAIHARDLKDYTINRLIRSGFDITGAALTQISGGVAPSSLSSAFALQRAKIFLGENLHRPDLSIVAAALAAGLSVRRLQELFQAEGLTVSGYLRGLRLKTAARHLAEVARSHQSIAEIMQSVGFSDQAQFSRAFRKMFGASPRAYRRDSHR